MPRTNAGKSREQLAQEAQERHTAKVMSLIRARMGESDINRHKLADLSGVEYYKLCRILRGDTAMSLWDMVLIADALKMDAEQRAVIIGGKACR